MYRIIGRRGSFRWAKATIGRRGIFLLMTGLMWATYGFSIIFVPLDDRFLQTDGPGADFHLLNDPTMGWVWLIGGLYAAVSAILRQRLHWTGVLAFNAIMTPPLLWLLGYIWSAALWIYNPAIGHPRAWISALVWLIVVGLVAMIADWPDPDDPALHRQVEQPTTP